MLITLLPLLGLVAAFTPSRATDTLDVARLAAAPVLDGSVGRREYGTPALSIPTAAGDVRVWIGRHGDFVHVAAVLPDSTFYWGDDFVVSLDPRGIGGETPGAGARQWYLRRTLDSSIVATAVNGRWQQPGTTPPMLGATRHHAEWDVASASSASGWSVELRIRTSAVRTGDAAPRIAFRTFNDAPQGWWSWPAAPSGVPAQRVERSPSLWAPMALR